MSSPKRKYSSLARSRARPEVTGDQSDPDLPTLDRLPIRPELQRPDSVITTSSAVSSEAEASVIEEADTEAEAGLGLKAAANKPYKGREPMFSIDDESGLIN